MPRTRLARGTAAALVAAAALATVRAHDPITTRVTWNGEVGRIVRARCISCHSEGGRAPMPLTTFREARPWAKAIREEVLTRRMPRWHAVRGYGAFSNDPSLSASEIALIAAWADGGAPEGPPVEPSAAAGQSTDPATRPDAPPDAREIPMRCGGPLPDGLLLAVRPVLAKGASVGFAARLPDGRVEVLLWIRGFDPDFATTYRLRTPLEIPPGTRLLSQASSGTSSCSLTLTMAPPR